MLRLRVMLRLRELLRSQRLHELLRSQRLEQIGSLRERHVLCAQLDKRNGLGRGLCASHDHCISGASEESESERESESGNGKGIETGGETGSETGRHDW